MPLQLFNSLGRRQDVFRPLKEGEVRMYTCGPTVWNYAHVGNFRTFVFEDLLRRYLKFSGYRVIQVMNITDVEDKIIKGIKQTHKTLKELTEFYEAAFMEDLSSLNVEKAEFYPRATEHVDDMLNLIRVLLAKGFAYEASDGSVYFQVSKFENYGELSGVRLDSLKPAGRVSSDHYEEKREAADFVLWKAWDKDDGDVYWDTELGRGRPGWNIECSAMSMKYLGESFDIHTGGMDNKFPHHENEIAQSEAATGKKFVNFWLHSEFMNFRGQEMHKSTGNFVTLRELIGQGWDPLTVRLFLLSSKYRDAIDLTDSALAQAEAERQRLQSFMHRLIAVRGDTQAGGGSAVKLLESFAAAMDDDLNTPAAVGALFAFVKATNNRLDSGEVGRTEAEMILKALRRVDGVLGVLRFDEEEPLPRELAELVIRRDEARKRKDFAEADELRAELLREGVLIEDTPQGTVWRRVTKPAS